MYDSKEWSIAKKLQESRQERLMEAYPPMLHKLTKYDQSVVRSVLRKAGVDIENTPYHEVIINSPRDPMLKGNDVLLIFEFNDRPRPIYAVSYNNKIIVDADIGADKVMYVSKLSWSNILNMADVIYAMRFNKDTNQSMRQKQQSRAHSKQGMEVRYTPKNKPPHVKIDKSGYIVDPRKYKDMLAELQIPKAQEILQSAKDMYARLAQNLDKIDFENDNIYYNYETIMRSMVTSFKELTNSLQRYEAQKAKNRVDDDWWLDTLKKDVMYAINNLREMMTKGKKYL